MFSVLLVRHTDVKSKSSRWDEREKQRRPLRFMTERVSHRSAHWNNLVAFIQQSHDRSKSNAANHGETGRDHRCKTLPLDTFEFVQSYRGVAPIGVVTVQGARVIANVAAFR
jgi:hypothetical protein